MSFPSVLKVMRKSGYETKEMSRSERSTHLSKLYVYGLLVCIRDTRYGGQDLESQRIGRSPP